MKLFFYKHYLALTLLSIFIAVGIFIIDDHGVGWDEPAQREMGLVSYNYITKGDKQIHNYLEKDHGVGFEVPLIFIERTLKLQHPQQIYTTRHIVTHLFFLLGAFIFYLLSSKIFKSRTLGIICFLALVCHPRLYVQSFINTKDIPFFVAYIFSLSACYRAYLKKDTASYILLGIAIGYATSIRMMSLIFIAVILFFILIDMLRAKQNKQSQLLAFTNPITFLVATAITTFIFWPMLWIRPFANFAEAYATMSKFRWDYALFFEGKMYSTLELPWYYLPKFISITTPILWVIGGLGGIILIIAKTLIAPTVQITDTKNRFLLTNLLLFIGTLSAIVVLDAVVYDGWRHVYYIYPSLLIMTIALLRYLQQKIRIRHLAVTICAIQIVGSIIYMIREHPYQMTYFNNLVSHDDEYLRNHYEMDYWGVATRDAFKYLLDHDSSSQIKVYDFLAPVTNNYIALPKEERERIQLVDCSDGAHYFITSFRGHPQEFDYPEKVYEIKTQGSTILAIYKMYEGEQYADKNCRAVWE